MTFIKTALLSSLLVLSILACAQSGSISGKVSNPTNGNPLAQADVFLANTSIRTQTDERGLYTLKDIPAGYYTLTALLPGYEPYQKSITLQAEGQSINISISAKSTGLALVQSEPDRKKNLALSLETFGKKRNGVKLLNPEKLNLTVKGKILEASSGEILNLENDYLGYHIKLLLKKYVKDISKVETTSEDSDLDQYEGIISFAELKGSTSDQNRWQANRLKAYQGSALHFYRSLISNDLKKQGFSIFPLVSKLNSKRASDSLIHKKIAFFENPASGKNRNDSLKFWKEQRDLPKYNHVLYRDSVKTSELITIDSTGLYELKYPYKLYVKYLHPDAEAKVMSDNASFDFHTPVNELSVSIELKDHVLRIDQNGNVVEPGRVKYEGGWAPKLAEILPLEYKAEKYR